MWSFIKLGGWVILWSIAWFFVLPFRKGRHNCLTWAVEKWDTEGGYLVIRWCRSDTLAALHVDGWEALPSGGTPDTFSRR